MAGFTVEFDVEEENPPSGWVTYRRFIERMRSRLGVRFSHNLPVLPVEEEPPTRWFDVVLRTNNHRITLTIRADTLYLVGYLMENSNQWLEFGSDTEVPRRPHLIRGSSFLGFGSVYSEVANAAGRRAAGVLIPQGRGDINLGQQQLVNAVNALATSTIRQVRARQLIVVAQMICESIRFDRISDYLSATFRVTPSLAELPPAPGWMQELENGWGQLSVALLQADADPDYRPFPLPQPNDMDIVTAEQAAAALGILKGFSFPPLSDKNLVGVSAGTSGSTTRGGPLVEIFSVRVNGIDGEDPGDLYGTITVIDGLGSQYIYNRKRGDYESIRPRDTALLTGPGRSISAYGSFTITVFLIDMDSDWSWDDEVSSGQTSWNVFDSTRVYDKLLSKDVDGRYGSVTVNYVVFSDAVQATVEVTLVNGSDGGNTADVYGLLTARNTKFSNESVLFRRSSDEDIGVSPGQRIRLSRSVVAVPLNSSLIVRADLMDRNTLSPDDEIAKGTADFPAQLSGTSHKYIRGKYGKILVKVIWTSY